MGDNITDLSAEALPPVPPKTYQWEDIRRQKLEGRYPWTHLYKPPFDSEAYEKTKDHEYEPVIPMDTNRNPPSLKVTVEEQTYEEPVQDTNHLCVPNEDIEYEDDSDELTAAELQQRLDEKYFQPAGGSKHDYELPEIRSVSPVDSSTSLHEKINLQTNKIKQKFKNFTKSAENSPRVKRKKDDAKPVKKNKFNFRKHNTKQDRTFNTPQSSRLSFSSLSSFSRSRSNSVKERSQSSESDKKKFEFNFGTYPRIFKKRKAEKDKQPNKSVPSTPTPGRSPFPKRWINKLTEKKEEKNDPPESKKETVVQESIFISLHSDTSTSPPDQPTEPEEKPTSMKIDNKNFIFISLHEERFPEKLAQAQQDEETAELDQEVERRKVETARKFTNLLRKLDTDRKLKSKRFVGKFTDDKPEPVTITEITTDDEGDVNLENSVESPEDTSEEIRAPSTEPASYVEESQKTSSKSLMPELCRTTTSQLPKAETPERATIQLEPQQAKSKSAEPKRAKTKSPELPRAKTKSPEPKRAKTKSPEPTEKSEKEPSKFAKLKEILNTEKCKPSNSNEPKEKEPSKFVEFKETIIKETEKIIKLGHSNESKEKESKKFTQFKESVLKDGKKSETSPSTERKESKFVEFKENLLKETEKIESLKKKIKNYFTKETENKAKSDTDSKHIYEEFDNIDDEPATKRFAEPKPPEEVPHKAPRKKLKKLDSDKESKESLSAFEDPVLNDIVTLDEQQPMTKTYITQSLQQVDEIPIEPEQSTKHFKNYEKALEKSRSQASIEIDNNLYSINNSLARLEAPVPPSRPSRTRSLQRKAAKPTIYENKENGYDLETNQNYNTFPMIKPDKPRRKFRKNRTYSNSTNTDVKSVNELEDATISQNIVNSKQLSVSFLPLTSNIVGEPIPNYNLRETSSMIHLNLNSDPPLPPKRRRSSIKDAVKCNTLPNCKYGSKTSSKTSLTVSETCNKIYDEDFEFADDAHSSAASDTPPRRPNRKRGPSLIDEDRTSREIESLPSERSLCDSDSKDINGYSVIKPAQKSHSQPNATTPRRKSRRLSDFFTLPRIRSPTNYVSPPSTLVYERRASPSRPPRRSKPFIEPVYTNEENINIISDVNFDDEEELNFNLATVEDEEPIEKDEKNLQADEVMERMKARPLPPPPRPIRKPRDDKDPASDYSQVKKNSNPTNNLNQEIDEPKIINTIENESVQEESPSCDIIMGNTDDSDLTLDKPSSSTLSVSTVQKLDVSEHNVATLSINELESSRFVTSNVDSMTMQVSQIKTETGNLVINSVQVDSLHDRSSPIFRELRTEVDSPRTRDVTPSSEDATIQEALARSRISSMIPEVGSDDESTSTVTKVVRPSRRKSVRKEESTRSTVTDPNQPTLAELMCQILQICHSSVGQAIHSLLEQIIPEDREKRNEVQAAIWVMTIIVAGCLMLGLQSNEKIVHHHHWDFHFPPPH